MAKLEVKMTDAQVKQGAIHGLEYCITSIIQQMQLKYNVRITGIRFDERTGILRNVLLDWEETASGIRTDKEVQELLNQQCEKKLLSITEKLANNS